MDRIRRHIIRNNINPAYKNPYKKQDAQSQINPFDKFHIDFSLFYLYVYYIK